MLFLLDYFLHYLVESSRNMHHTFSIDYLLFRRPRKADWRSNHLRQSYFSIDYYLLFRRPRKADLLEKQPSSPIFKKGRRNWREHITHDENYFSTMLLAKLLIYLLGKKYFAGVIIFYF